uniref:Rhodanese domain-containing protein n=1 Tax=Araucaria cunninghamii TaxID=56994 RepID=A0A0D6QRL4_ARACU
MDITLGHHCLHFSSNFSSGRALVNKVGATPFEDSRQRVGVRKVSQNSVVSQRLYSKRTQVTRIRMETNSPKTVSVQVAHELVQAGHRYMDVRTPEEFNAGHIEGSLNVPYMFKAGEGMTKNPNFIQEVLSHFSKDDEIVVGCQSGRRSLMAAKDLVAAEFTGVTDVGGGYSAWVQSGLPVKCNI